MYNIKKRRSQISRRPSLWDRFPSISFFVWYQLFMAKGHWATWWSLSYIKYLKNMQITYFDIDLLWCRIMSFCAVKVQCYLGWTLNILGLPLCFWSQLSNHFQFKIWVFSWLKMGITFQVYILFLMHIF